MKREHTTLWNANNQESHSAISETFDLADDQNIKQYQCVTANNDEEETFTSDSVKTSHFKKYFEKDR